MNYIYAVKFILTTFTHKTWYTHCTLHTLSLSFTHDTQDIVWIYAMGNLFTHDTQDKILFTHDTQDQMLFTHHTQTHYYLHMIRRIYAAFKHDT
jgi:hypothetical protein